jgi:methylmalonyl-CoA mutase cobalamin-binding subunit
MGKRIIAITLGPCVHVAGIYSFFRLAEAAGYQTHFLGIGTNIPDVINAVREDRPDYLAVSFRLTPSVGARLGQDLKNALDEAGLSEQKLIFGGTPPVAQLARESGIFTAVFCGDEKEEDILGFLRGEKIAGDASTYYGERLIERLRLKRPFPLIRHHFGLPNLEATIDGVGRLAEAKVLDVISLAPDQNAQASFFRPNDMDPSQDGAGGVPIRTPADLQRLYTASRTGNQPLMRCYSGTRDLEKWALMAQETIHNAWAAIPLFWYSRLDGRSDRPLSEAIDENQKVMAWHGKREIPVEVNEAHHWSLRGAPDAVAVAAAFLAAYNGKQAGVKDYIVQLMLNNPPGTSSSNDLAKMGAKLRLIEELVDDNFRVIREIRAGLASLSPRANIAKGQLASSTQLGLALDPDIIHVVAYCEADHAAGVEEIIESCDIVEGVLKNGLFGSPDLWKDPKVISRCNQLMDDARFILDKIARLSDAEDPWSDPMTLSLAVRSGLLDAPQLAGNPEAFGRVRTGVIDGACQALCADGKRVLTEKERLTVNSNQLTVNG